MFSLICVAPILINLSKEPWIDHDFKILKRVKTRCQNYYKDAPCVKKFIKKKPRSYNVICGKLKK